MSDINVDKTHAYNIVEKWLTRAWSPSLPVVISTSLVAFLLPIFLHFYLYKTRTTTKTPTFLIAGPSGTGKTALLTLVCTKDSEISQIVTPGRTSDLS